MGLAGYPDWERVQREGGDLVTILNQAVTTTATLGPFNVQQWKSLRMQAAAPTLADIYKITWNWYDTVTLANLLSTQSQVLETGDSFGVAVPTQGPYVQIVITTLIGGFNVPIVISLAGLRSIPSNFQMGAFGAPLVFDQHSYVANGASVFTGPQYYGNAILHVSGIGGAVGPVTFQYYDRASNSTRNLYAFSSVPFATPLIQVISIPLTHYQINVTNGAAINTILTTLMPAAP